MQVSAFVFINIFMYYVSDCICTYVYVCKCIYEHIHTYAYNSICIFIICVCLCLYICQSVCIYIHHCLFTNPQFLISSGRNPHRLGSPQRSCDSFQHFSPCLKGRHGQRHDEFLVLSLKKWILEVTVAWFCLYQKKWLRKPFFGTCTIYFWPGIGFRQHEIRSC